MSTQADVHSIEALKDLRAALALYAEDTLAALSAVDMELRRVTHWLQYDRPSYWQNQIKRRREEVSSARADVFRRKLSKTGDGAPSVVEQMELLKRAEAGLRDAEARAVRVKKWGPALQQAVLEYHASTRRLSDLAGGEVPRAMAALGRMVDALESYLRVAPPSGAAPPPLESIAEAAFRPDTEPAPAAEAGPAGPGPAEEREEPGPEAEGQP
jgi:hypothetical protein